MARALEPFAFCLAVLAYTWWLAPAASSGANLVLQVLLGCLPVASNVARRESLREAGLRLDTLPRSAREVAVPSAVFAALVLLIGGMSGHWPALAPKLEAMTLYYPAWALWQQYTLQAFVYRRLLQGCGHPNRAAGAAALLFGVVHLPSPVLVVLTTLGGLFWCRAYQRTPNLFTLAASHAALATLLLSVFPPGWLHQLRVGPGYWE